MEETKFLSVEQLNPRYVNYCRVNGNTPQKQAELDAFKSKGGKMIPYSSFISEQIGIFRKTNPECFTCGSLTDHKAFDLYLDNLPVKELKEFSISVFLEEIETYLQNGSKENTLTLNVIENEFLDYVYKRLNVFVQALVATELNLTTSDFEEAKSKSIGRELNYKSFIYHELTEYLRTQISFENYIK